MEPLIALPSYRRERETRCLVCDAISPAGLRIELHKWGCLEVPEPPPWPSTGPMVQNKP